MTSLDTLLLAWAGQYNGLGVGHVARAAALSALICPDVATPTDRTILSRWFTWVFALHDYTRHDLCLPPAQATALWRGLRAVAEGRAAPTSPLGAALSDLVANLSRLRHVGPADSTLVALGVGHFLDGLARLYEEQRRGTDSQRASAPPNLAIRAQTSGFWGAWTWLSATRSWGLSRCLISHPARRLLPTLEHAAIVCCEAAVQPAGAAADPALSSVELTLRSLPAEWADFSRWSRHLLTNVGRWSAAEHWQDEATRDADAG